MDLTRRGLLKVGGLVLAAPAGIAASAGRAAAAARPLRTVTLTGVAFGTGTYNYHPFKVPVGVNRLDVRIVKQGNAKRISPTTVAYLRSNMQRQTAAPQLWRMG